MKARTEIGLVFAVAAVAALGLGGCQNSPNGGAKYGAAAVGPTASLPTPPALDTSSPDRTLKSYWAYKDYVEKARMATQRNIHALTKSAYDDLASAEFAGSKLVTFPMSDNSTFNKKLQDEVKAELDKEFSSEWKPTYRREILKVDKETETRAIALVKVTNIKPLPPQVTLTPDELTKRNSGEEHRYIIEKEADGWKIANVQLFQRNYKTERVEWTNRFEPHNPDRKPSPYTYTDTSDY